MRISSIWDGKSQRGFPFFYLLLPTAPANPLARIVCTAVRYPLDGVKENHENADEFLGWRSG